LVGRASRNLQRLDTRPPFCRDQIKCAIQLKDTMDVDTLTAQRVLEKSCKAWVPTFWCVAFFPEKADKKVNVKGHSRGDFVSARLEELNRIRGAGGHRTSPFVYRGCGDDKEYVGGATDFLQEIENKHQASWQKIQD
jgi:hypothetical protein